MLYATHGWLTAGRPKVHPRTLPPIGSIMAAHIGLTEPSPASSQWLTPGTAPNVQSDQFGGVWWVCWEEAERVGASRDEEREPCGQQSTCHGQSSTSLRDSRPGWPGMGGRVVGLSMRGLTTQLQEGEKIAFLGLSDERESR